MKKRSSTGSRLVRLPVPMPPELIRLIDGCVPAGQSRAEWIRESIRQRIVRDGPARV